MILRFIGVDMVSNMLRSIGGSMDTLQGKLSGSADSFQKKMSSISSSFLGLATVFGGLTLGVGAAFVSAAKDANTFDQQVFLLHAHGNLAAGDIQKMKDGLLSMGDATGYSAQELGKAMFYIESVKGLSMNVGQALGVQTAAAKLARIANADLTQTTKTLVQILSSGITTNNDYAAAAGQVNQVVANGVMTMDELNVALRTGLAPSAAGLHIPITQIGAALGSLTQDGYSSASAATALRNSFIFLTKDTKASETALGRIGLSYNDVAKFMNKGDLVGALTEIHNAVEKTFPNQPAEQLNAIGSFFGRTRGATAGMSLMQDLAKMPAIMQSIAEGGNKINTDFADYLNTPAGATQRLEADLQNLWTTVGEGANSIIPGLVKSIDPMIEGTQRWISQNHGLISSIGPAVVQVLAFSTGIAGLAAVLTALLAINPVTLGIVGTIVAGAILIKDNWGKVQPTFTDLASFLQDDLFPVAQKVWTIFDKDIAGAFITVGGVILTVLLPPLKLVFGALNDVLGWIQGPGGGVTKAFMEGIGTLFVVNKVRDWGVELTKWTGKALSDITAMVAKFLNLPSSKSGGGGVGGSSPVSNVGDMNVANLIVKSMIGGPGGSPIPVGGAGDAAVVEDGVAAAGAMGIAKAIGAKLLTGASIALIVVPITDAIMHGLFNTKSLFDPQSWKDFFTGLVNPSGNIAGGTPTGKNTPLATGLYNQAYNYNLLPGMDPGPFQQKSAAATAEYLQGWTITAQKSKLMADVMSRNVDDIGKTASLIGSVGGPAAENLVNEWKTLGKAVAANAVTTESDLNEFHSLWQQSNQYGLGAADQQKLVVDQMTTYRLRTLGYTDDQIKAMGDTTQSMQQEANTIKGVQTGVAGAAPKFAQSMDAINGHMADVERYSGAWAGAVGGVVAQTRDMLTVNDYVKKLLAQVGIDAADGSAISDGYVGTIRRLSGLRALGGPVYAGSTYQVNEHGQEFFTPSVNGYVIPNGGSGNNDSGAMLSVLQQMLSIMMQQAKNQPGSTAPAEVDQRAVATGVMQQIYSLMNEVGKQRRRGLYGAATG